MTEINKCPVCGGQAEVNSKINLKQNWAVCKNKECATSGPLGGNTVEAIAAWNRLSYKAPVKKATNIGWVRKVESYGPVDCFVIFDAEQTVASWIAMGYKVMEIKEVEFEIE